MLSFNKIASWLGSDDLTEQQIGLNALKSLLTSREFENFPQFIQLLAPYTRKAPPQIPRRCPRGSQCAGDPYAQRNRLFIAPIADYP